MVSRASQHLLCVWNIYWVNIIDSVLKWYQNCKTLISTLCFFMAKCVAEMVAREHYNIWIQWKNAFHKSAQVGDAVWPFWILKKKFTPKKWWKRNSLQRNDEKEIHSQEIMKKKFTPKKRFTQFLTNEEDEQCGAVSMFGRFEFWKKKSSQKTYFKLKLSNQNKYNKNTNRTEAALFKSKKKIGLQTQN